MVPGRDGGTEEMSGILVVVVLVVIVIAESGVPPSIRNNKEGVWILANRNNGRLEFEASIQEVRGGL